jgi:hypothetical protein
MSEDFKSRIITACDDAERDITVNRKTRINFAAINNARERCFGESCTDISGNFEHGNRRIKLASRGIRQGYEWHAVFLGQWQRLRCAACMSTLNKSFIAVGHHNAWALINKY